MVKDAIATVKEFIDGLDDEKRKTVAKVRALVRKNIPKGYKENFNWGMICYEIPLKVYPNTYNKKPLMYCAIAVNKNNYSLHLMNVYSNPKLQKQLERGFKDAGKKLDMGKGCLRFKTLDDIPLDVLSEIVASTTVDEYIQGYESARKR